jgi:hypothetical protein
MRWVGSGQWDDLTDHYVYYRLQCINYDNYIIINDSHTHLVWYIYIKLSCISTVWKKKATNYLPEHIASKFGLELHRF